MRCVPYPQREQQLQTLQLGWETQHNVSFTPFSHTHENRLQISWHQGHVAPRGHSCCLFSLQSILPSHAPLLRGGSVINARLAGGQNIWLESRTRNFQWWRHSGGRDGVSCAARGRGYGVIYQTFTFTLKTGLMHNHAHTHTHWVMSYTFTKGGKKPPVWGGKKNHLSNT